MFQVISSILLLICSIWLFIDGFLSYRYQRVTKSNRLLDRERLADKKGYTQWYGKRMMLLGTVAFAMSTAYGISHFLKEIDFLFTLCLIGYFVITVVFFWQNVTKLDRFYGEKQDL